MKALFGKSPFQLQWCDTSIPKLQSGQVFLPLEALLSHVFWFKDADKAFQAASNQQEQVVKVVLKS